MPEEQFNTSLNREISDHYYYTTAGRSHRRDIKWYEHASKQKIRRVKQWLPPDKNSNILEIGCGCGEMLFGLEKRGYLSLKGIDYCQAELEEAKKYVNCQFFQADIVEYLTTTQERYDLVIAYNVLEHFDKERLLIILRNIYRILNPDGSLIAMVPNAVSPMGGSTRYWDITHEISFTANNWYQLASLVGFDPKPDINECGPLPHGPVSFIRYLLWQFFRIFIKVYLFCEVASDRGGIYTQDMMVRLKMRGETQ